MKRHDIDMLNGPLWSKLLLEKTDGKKAYHSQDHTADQAHQDGGVSDFLECFYLLLPGDPLPHPGDRSPSPGSEGALH